MYIAMNRFRVRKGSEDAFEKVWRERDTHLGDVPGFVSFSLLRGAEREDHTLFASHSIWKSYEDFEAWTKSDAFRKAHADAGQTRDYYLGHPEFEGFRVVVS